MMIEPDRIDTVPYSDAAWSMMPGFVEPSTPAPAPVAAPQGIELDLLLANLCAALQKIKTDPGVDDHVFIKSVRGRRPSRLTPDERTRLHTLRWKYRMRLPEGLRLNTRPG